MFLVEGGTRPTLPPDDRDDAKAVLALAVAGSQRERAAADQHYVRGRNFLAFTATLFTAVQAAFLANIGRESGDKVLLNASERGDVIIPAAVGALALVLALGFLLFWLDRPRKIAAIGATTLTNAWLDPEGEHKEEAVVDVLAAKAIQEEREWAESNESRKTSLAWISGFCGLAGLAALVELVVLYGSLV